MTRVRSFRNDDPPGLAEVWRSQPPSRGLVQPMTAVILDELVLSKPYFDRHGLVVAEAEDGRRVGFGHAAFLPSEDGSRADVTQGVVCMVMASPGDNQQAVMGDLLAACEGYLRAAGATTIYGGGLDRLAPYYQGLYGGTVPPGILASDQLQTGLFTRAGYTACDRRQVFERRLVSFRPAVDREIIQLRRKYQLQRGPRPMPEDWWSACTWGQLDLVRYELARGGDPVAGLVFSDVEPLASSWGVHAGGLIDWSADGELPQVPLLTHLLGESLREMQSQGVTVVELQVSDPDNALQAACQRLGFHEVDQGVRFRKDPAG